MINLVLQRTCADFSNRYIEVDFIEHLFYGLTEESLVVMQFGLFESSVVASARPEYVGDLPEGLRLVPDFISESEEKSLINQIDASTVPWSNELHRRVKHFGFKYDYRGRALTLDDRTDSIPHWASTLGQRLVALDYFHVVPDQVIVNEYLPGQGISKHIDRESCFGPVVASLSIGSDAIMDFDGPSGKRGSVELLRRSVVILSGEARYVWKHSIAARKVDIISNRRIHRRRRVSLTFRTVVLP